MCKYIKTSFLHDAERVFFSYTDSPEQFSSGEALQDVVGLLLPAGDAAAHGEEGPLLPWVFCEVLLLQGVRYKVKQLEFRSETLIVMITR